MARYDKYDGVAGGFRVPASEAQLEANYGVPLGLGVNADGAGTLGDPENSGFVGVCIVDRTKRRAGDILDVMTNGEIVYDSDDTATALVAGTTYYLNAATGVLQTAETRYKVGHTIEAWRLIVRFQDQGAA
jgi:hypothetical protein